MSNQFNTLKFSVNHLADNGFESGGLRSFFEYRDLGITEATNNCVGAHVIRGKPGCHVSGEQHTHKLQFQMVYIMKGWIKFWYEGVGEVKLIEGSCVHQPPGITHQDLEHSNDVEILEITLPAHFDTQLAK